jgi:AraC-like DNA-binding protein
LRTSAWHFGTDARLSISRIAWLLGSLEVNAFTRAFRRWTGQTLTPARAKYLGRSTARDAMA